MFSRILAVLFTVAVTVLVTPAWGACPGDLNGDGVVLVDEVLTMVGEALNGCPGHPAACPGDADGDGSISVADILAAVNAVLAGCPAEPTATATALPATTVPTLSPTPSETPTVAATATATATTTPSPTPTPAACPFTFDDDTLSQDVLCDFIGPFSADPSCPSDLEALFTSDGSTTVGVAIGTVPDVVMFVGTKVSSTQADLTGYTVGPDTIPTAVSGKIELKEGGRTLVIAPDGSPFDLGTGQQVCGFDQYAGSFIRVLGGQVAPPLQRATSVRLVAWSPGSHLSR